MARALRRRVVSIRLLGCSWLLALLQATIPTTATAGDWVEVVSPNFRVVNDRGERTARRVAVDLERIRRLLQNALPEATADPLRPVLVVAVRGEDDLVELLPQFEDTVRPSGVFIQGAFQHHIVLRVEAGRETIYHEYFHLLTGLNTGRLPPGWSKGSRSSMPKRRSGARPRESACPMRPICDSSLSRACAP